MSDSIRRGATADGAGRGGIAQGARPRLPADLPAASAFRHTARLAALRPLPVGAGMRARLMDIWPGLLLRKFASDADCAACFGVERQTATYWRSGDTGPNGAAVALAWLMWPAEMTALLGGK